jgi:hypothetical protein
VFPGEGIAIAFIYCNHKEQTTQRLRELVASLLKQFIQDHPVISESAKSLYSKHYAQDTRPNLDELRETLREEVQRFSRAFVIIDALDELVEQDRHRLIKEVQSMGNTVRLMVTSRELTSIEPIFLGAKSIDIRARKEDLRKYIKRRIGVLSSLRSSVFAGVDEIEEKISTNVRGMYVYPFSL